MLNYEMKEGNLLLKGVKGFVFYIFYNFKRPLKL